ncbi:DUF6712 family protein [Dysgonomonas macrotermitis]|uniref:Uncharacterized protein n=1 Tax=Dysgonomonas macrotermitis TaxID=1346286 RepID=A0A1M4UJ21_9BACT|nr:DUF6712 family protein [Dysgonomonas macrotermitis]SHE56654.1 hypothetical protein SAMN05444362_101617 [Dysgonomonas macrotermitis]
MIINSIDEFVSFIPTAYGYNPDDKMSDYDIIKPFLQESEIWVKDELLGADLFSFAEMGTDQELHDSIARVIACSAYYSCIPFVDLIQTPNGFAVVSNSNQAPASKERVERLLNWVKTRYSEAVDMLILMVFKNQDYNLLWKKSDNYNRYTECLIMTAASLRKYGRKDAQRDTLDELHPMLMSYQMQIAKMISPEYMDELIQKRRNQDLTDSDMVVLLFLYSVIGLMLKKEHVYPMLETIVNTMVKDLDQYPAYKNSETYRLKISDKFQNSKDSSIFVW